MKGSGNDDHCKHSLPYLRRVRALHLGRLCPSLLLPLQGQGSRSLCSPLHCQWVLLKGMTMKLTKRGQKVVGIIGVFGFLALLGIAGYVEGLG